MSAVVSSEVKEQDSESMKAMLAAPSYANKDEAVAAFHSLLQDKKVSVTATWNEIITSIVIDKRFKALKTTRERQEALESYKRAEQQRLDNVEEESEKQEVQAFLELLMEQRISTLLSFSELCDIDRLADDSRYRHASKSARRRAWHLYCEQHEQLHVEQQE